MQAVALILANIGIVILIVGACMAVWLVSVCRL